MDCTRCLLITSRLVLRLLLSPYRRGERPAAASRMSATGPTLRDVYQFTLGQLSEQEQKSVATAFSAVSALKRCTTPLLQPGSQNRQQQQGGSCASPALLLVCR